MLLPATARLLLVVGAAISVVDAVTESRGAILGHILVGAQNMLLGILSAGRAGAGPRRTELAGRLVLICEEGLVPPINTKFRICLRQCVHKGETRAKGVGSLPRGTETGRS